MAEPTHKLYLDDSGTKEYVADRVYSPGSGRTPYFGFGGILVRSGEAGALSRKLRSLKLEAFGTEQVEIKANWLRRREEREKRYLAPFKLTIQRLDTFVDAVYSMIGSSNVSLLASIVDKAAVQREYDSRAFYAPAIAYECIAQRVQLEMMACGGYVHVTIDDMTGATPKGSQYRDNLERHHRLLRTSGSQLQRGKRMDRLEGIAFTNSAADERIQLADLVIYCVNKQFTEHGAEWDGSGDHLPVYAYLGRILGRFCRSPSGVVDGYGIVKFPRLGGNRWSIGEQ